MTSIFLTIPLTLISIIGLLLNGCILVAVLLTRQVSAANNILLLHLGVLDALLGALFLVFSFSSLTKTTWLSSGAPCILHGFLYTLFHPLVLWTICGLNCDRYYAIAAPLHYGHIVSAKKVLVGLGVGWGVSLILSIPPFFKIAPYSYIPGLAGCAPNFSLGPGTLIYSTLYTAFTLLLPATLIICCNLKILMIARYHRHRIASAIYEVTLSAQVTITHQRNPFFVPTVTAPAAGGPKFRGRSAIYTVIQLVGSFLILYLPYYILILWESTKLPLAPTNKNTSYFFAIASTLLVTSSPINGFLYGVKNKTLRKTFRNYWRKKQTKSEVNQEIQARTPSTCGSRRPSLTPLGFLTKPNFQRRLSEALLDVQKSITSPQKNKIKRISSELTYRPSSNSSLNFSPKEELKTIKQTVSCNALKVPSETPAEEEICVQITKLEVLSPSKSNATYFLQKFFGSDDKSAKVDSPKRSPRIMITRAFSEESEKTSLPSSPSKDLIITKKHSSSATTLLERKWKQMRYKVDDDDSNCNSTIKPLLDNSSLSYKSSDSSETSDLSSGQIYMNLDKSLTDDETKESLLNSWPCHKKLNSEGRRRSSLLKQTLVGVQSQEYVL